MLRILLVCLLALVATPFPASAQVTLLVPSAPEVDATNDAEVDVLITMMHPFAHKGLVMDMPQLFSVLRFEDGVRGENGRLAPERADLLGDVEEIVYLGQKAWGANVALHKPGLYQFLLEARPWWDEARDRFVQHYVKVMVPVQGQAEGWSEPAGQRFEIVPSVRPFGLTQPSLFSGQVLLDGQPLPNALVRIERINTDGRKVPTPWHEHMEVRTDAQGRFSAVLNQSGWWSCMAVTAGAPLKGTDGQNKELELGALFWLYVDSAIMIPDKR